jgi:hypothetical protein
MCWGSVIGSVVLPSFGKLLYEIKYCMMKQKALFPTFSAENVKWVPNGTSL